MGVKRYSSVLPYSIGKEKMTERNILPEMLIFAQLVKKSPAVMFLSISLRSSYIFNISVYIDMLNKQLH